MQTTLTTSLQTFWVLPAAFLTQPVSLAVFIFLISLCHFVIYFIPPPKDSSAAARTSLYEPSPNELPESRVDLARGIVNLVNESQKGLEMDFSLSSDKDVELELECGLLDRIQTLMEHREALINTAV